ncbi:hypothetical protein DFH06DRAFT_1305951 [Mycena polygramma]|nr:hypothetical protein DFH06DRAFT_1305951 [Mycena polygramma]
MPPQPQIRLTNIKACLAVTADSLEVLASGLKEPSLEAISYTTKSLLQNVETIKQNKDECAQLLEQTHKLLNAVLVTYLKSDTGADLPPSVLSDIGKFSQTLHKVHTFVEAQQKGSKIKRLFRQGDLNNLLKGCREGLQQGLDSFQLSTGNIMKDITTIRKESEEKHKEVLQLIEALTDASSDQASTISKVYSGSHNRLFLINRSLTRWCVSSLPNGHAMFNQANIARSPRVGQAADQPKIFHSRDSEISKILHLFDQGTPRIAILGAGGIGKTTRTRGVLHCSQITTKYEQHRYFVACDTATTKVEVAALIGVHLGLQPGKDLSRAVVQYFSGSPSSLLILDNLETSWEPLESRKEVEEFLSLLTDVKHLALMITMRGAEHPAKVAWTHPFLPLLRPLEQDAARQMFIDIADDAHNPEEVDKVLALTDNMPLAIDLLAHLVDSQGCSTVLSRWEEEKTSMISDGWDRRSNLDLSISLSLLSPRLQTFPHAQKLLSLLSVLPNGLSDAELMNIYMQKIQPPNNDLIRPLCKYFQELLEFVKEYYGTVMGSGAVAQVSSNLANIQSILQKGLHRDHPDLVDCIYCTCYLSSFSHITGQESLISQTSAHFELCSDPDLKCRFYNNVASIYQSRYEFHLAQQYFELALSLAVATGNTKRHSGVLRTLAAMNWSAGHYFEAQAYAKKSQRLARIAADILGEAYGLRVEAVCWCSLGNYNQSLSLCNQARELLASCGMSNCLVSYAITNMQAEIHKSKSEFTEARNLHQQLLSITKNSVNHSFALNAGITSYCLERLGDVGRWGPSTETSSWATLLLAHSLKLKDKLLIYKALLFFGQIFHRQADKDTAVNLFNVALEGFTQMGVHCSQAECMLHLGDVSKGRGDLLKAVELWDTARPLFERSSQGKQVKKIDERLALVGKDLLEQHRKSLACLAELNVPSGTIEEAEDELSDIEDLDVVEEEEGALVFV